MFRPFVRSRVSAYARTFRQLEDKQGEVHKLQSEVGQLQERVSSLLHELEKQKGENEKLRSRNRSKDSELARLGAENELHKMELENARSSFSIVLVGIGAFGFGLLVRGLVSRRE